MKKAQPRAQRKVAPGGAPPVGAPGVQDLSGSPVTRDSVSGAPEQGPKAGPDAGIGGPTMQPISLEGKGHPCRRNGIDPLGSGCLNGAMANVPGDLRYTKTHEWVRLGDGVATVGITDHAQRELTDIVFVELPPVGRELRAGEACGVVESVKTASDLYSPLSGRVLEVNTALPENPGWINSDPYGQGWLFKLIPSQPTEWEALLSPQEYQAQITGD